MTTYGIRLAIIYSLVWFIDLLDASMLNVAMPAISSSFQIDPATAEWAIVGFLLTMSIGITISGSLGDRYGTRAIFLLSQILYIASSIGCGISFNFGTLVAFRLIQGFAAGMAIPLGMAALMRAMPQSHWAKTTAYMNMVSLIAPALGPLFGAYVTSLLDWRSLFICKLPLSILCLFFSIRWIKSETPSKETTFDWTGFLLGSCSLSGILLTFSEVGKSSYTALALAMTFSLLLTIFFIRKQRLFPLAIFTHQHFSFGNLIQSAANTIFLGANFLIALYLQKGLGLDLMTTGWIMAAITPGMLVMQPVVGKLYNSVGPLPFIIPGLLLLSLSTLAFSLTTVETSPYLLGLLVFCIGAASSMAQSANVTSIFSGLPKEYKNPGSVLYSLFKQLSASFGVAVSAMVLSLSSFEYSFIALGVIPLLALSFCFFIDNKRALAAVQVSS